MAVTTLDPKTALLVIDLQNGIVAFPTIHPVDGSGAARRRAGRRLPPPRPPGRAGQRDRRRAGPRGTDPPRAERFPAGLDRARPRIEPATGRTIW